MNVPAVVPWPPTLVVMGVMGTGKTTVAELIAQDLGWDYAEADRFHPRANIDKMAAGVPLTDADRGPWLEKIAAWARDHEAEGKPCVVTCSALKRSYRDVLRSPHVVFVHLAGSRETIAARVAGRHGHFMPLSLLDSQLATLEAPGADECAIAIDLDAGGTPRQVADQVVAALGALGVTSATRRGARSRRRSVR